MVCYIFARILRLMTFQELGLKPELLSAITEIGFETPMPVQQQTIPFIFEQTDDLVVLAQTGTGKTAAFGLPILNLIDSTQQKVQALILAPTRELCIQIANDLNKFAKHLTRMRVVPIYGGESIVKQLKQVDVQPQVLVATPGRLLDMLRRKKVHLNAVSFLVLDEADEMLNMGFLEDIETILQALPDTRRTMLFSATMPAEIARIARNYMKTSHEITVGVRNAGAENVSHLYYVVQAKQRYLALKRIVDMNPDIYGIVFCRTRQETKEVAEKLIVDGYNADALHGDLSQVQRDSVMSKFRLHGLQLLVATDVAARGLDVHNLTHVINYNLPDDAEVYTHRSGRTGRANKKGISISIIHTRERNRIRSLEKLLKKEFTQVPVPDGMAVCKKQLFHLINKMEKVEVCDEIEPFLPEIEKKLAYLEKEDMLRRFVSLEFNRFLEYYKNAPDLNVPEKEIKPAKKSGKSTEKTKRKGKLVRFRLNVGTKQNFNINRLLAFINDIVCDRSIKIGSIELIAKASFFDVYADQAEQVFNAFEKFAPNGIRLEAVGTSSLPKSNRKKPQQHKKETDSSKKSTSNSDKPWRRRR